MCHALKTFPLAQDQSHNLITSITCCCHLFLKRQSLLVTLGRQPAGQDSLPPARQQGRIMGTSSPHSKGRGLLWRARKMHSGPLLKHKKVGFGHFRTAAACQQSWERMVGWSCTVPQSPASSQCTHAYFCCCCTYS